MNRRLLALMVLLLAIFSLFAERISLNSQENQLQVIQSSPNETILQYTISKFDTKETNINNQKWFHLSLPGEGVTQVKGMPELPVFNRSIIIDNSARMRLEIFDVQYTDLRLPVAPSKGVITRDIDPKTVAYTFSDVYDRSDFYPAQIAELSEPYIMRDFRGITIITTPFAYRPDTKTLRVYHSYKIRVYQEGIDTRNVLQQTRSNISRSFADLYQNHFVNWNSYRYTPLDDSYGKLLVVCHSSFMSTIQPWVNWKRQMGVETELVEWSTIGNTAAQLQSYIQTRYNQDNSLTYVQIVGDAPQIPTLSSGGGGSDPTFSLVAGSDNYPDIFIGRFSAGSVSELSPQINRSIYYERDASTSDTWLSRATGIASAEGGGTQGDNGESDIQHMNNIRTKLLNYGYSTVDQVYDPGASASTVSTNVNAGRGFINYVGHGSDTSWVTTGFSNSHALALTNGNKAPFIVDVACVNGNFVSMTCFAEAWMRNPNGGAITIYASTINQSWNSPMRAQDEITDLWTVDAKKSAGGYYYSGSCKMMDTYGNTTGSDGVNMFKTWHIFGDASLMPRSKTPLPMTVTHPEQIIIGAGSMEISTGVANALVSLTYDNQIYARGFTNSSGTLALPLNDLPAGSLDYSLTVTAGNRVTYIGSVQSIPGTGPYIVAQNISYSDAYNNSPEYGDRGSFQLTFQNIGASAASGVSAHLSCSTPGITLLDSSEPLGHLSAGESIVHTGAYVFDIANSIADGTIAEFTINIVSESDSWQQYFTLPIHAPSLAFGDLTITDPSGNNNGNLDPGETVTITVPIHNVGGATSPSGTANLSCFTLGIMVDSGSTSFSPIPAGGSIDVNFEVTAHSTLNQGTFANLNFSASAGAYTVAESTVLEIGAPAEVTIGSGTSSQTYPLDRYFTYSSHEAIYLASEIATPGTIKSMAYYKASGSDENPILDTDIYMKHTTATSLSTGSYSLAGYSLVYSGNFPNNATSGWMEIELDTRFLYDGISNLSVLVIKGEQAWISNYPNWTYSSTATARARQNRSDSSQPTSLTSSTNLPNLKLKIFATDPEDIFLPPQNLSASTSHQSVALSWEAPVSGTPTAYKVYRNSTLLTTVSSMSYSDTAVTNGTTYSYYVTARYSGGESDASNTVNATPNSFAPSNLEAVAGNGYVSLSWDAASGRIADVLHSRNSSSRAINGYRIYRDGYALTTVSGTNYIDNTVVNETLYSYYVTTIYTNPTGESAPSNTVQAIPTAIIPSEAILGNGTASTTTSDMSPINVWYKSLHGQSVYTAAELNAAGISGPVEISHLGFNITALPALAMPNFVVRMKHTTAVNVANWVDATNLSTVYSNSSYLPTQTGWNLFTLSTPFMWNGTDNILIDTAFGLMPEYNQSGTVQYTTVSNGYRCTRNDSSNQTNTFTGGSVSSKRPNLKLIYNQSSENQPSIAVSPSSITETVNSGDSVSRNITISNNGSAELVWSIPVRNSAIRDMTGSTLTSDVNSYIPGSNATWIFTVTNNSQDYEWIRDIDITFPETVTVNSVTSFSGGEYPLTASPQSGTGISINWHFSDANDYGGIYPNQTATATINVTISASTSGTLSLPWTISGDEYGADPHSVSGTLVFSQNGEPEPVDWFTINTHSGNIAPGTSTVISVTLDTNDLPDGTYTSSFTINSNAQNNPALIVPLSLTVETPEDPFPIEPRFVAEWEPATGAIVRYPFGQPYSLLRDLSQDALLYVIVTSANQSTANSSLQSNGVTMANVRYINAASDSYWVRDYGAWTIFDADHNMHLVDFAYNRPRPNDDIIPITVADYLGKEIYDLNINHTGGNIMTDGMGKAMSTELVLSENISLSQTQINQRFSDFLGVSEYQIYTDPTNTYIDHIDCWAKLLDVDKVIIRRVPTGHPQYAAIEASVAQWQAKTSSYGTPYRIFRVDTPNDEPYTNSFIMNGNIYVPQMGTTNDALALATYRTAMPGFTVRGYSYSNYESTDALHCRVNTIFDDQMIAVRHIPSSSLLAYANYNISVEVDHANPLDPIGTYIHWSTSPTGPWQQASLSSIDADTWTASISIPAVDNIYYYVRAQDSSGRVTKLPLCAELDPFVIAVQTDTALPEWTPVTYSNPPVTVHAVVNVMGIPAQVGDLVGAFVGDECRGTGLVYSNRTTMVSMQIQLAEPEETVMFRVFSQADGMIYDADIQINPSFGDTIGGDLPIEIICALAQPNVVLGIQEGNFSLSWNEILNATAYKILASDNPYAGFAPLLQTSNTSISLPMDAARRFFKVVAVKENPAKRN